NGDFSSAGSADIGLKAEFPGGAGQLTVGSNDYQRLFAAVSPAFDGGRRLLAAAELQRADGPWNNPQDLRKKNAVLRFSEGTTAIGYDVTLMAYQSRWNATDQVPQRAVDSGLIGRFGAVDPSDGGESERYSVSAELRRAVGNGGWRASVYA